MYQYDLEIVRTIIFISYISFYASYLDLIFRHYFYFYLIALMKTWKLAHHDGFFMFYINYNEIKILWVQCNILCALEFPIQRYKIEHCSSVFHIFSQSLSLSLSNLIKRRFCMRYITNTQSFFIFCYILCMIWNE